jgi:site-specific recombinase XerD
MFGLWEDGNHTLNWVKDVNFEGNTITVNKSLYYEGGAHLKSTKTEAGERIVPLLAPLKEILLPIKKSPEDFVLGETKGKPLSQKRFRTLSKHYEEQTGVKVELHRLRHSYATIAVKNNVPPKILQTVLGHKNISTTMDIYTDVRKESIDMMGEILNDFYTKK